VLAEYIDSELDHVTENNLSIFTSTASQSIYWLECGRESSYKICPDGEEQKKWIDRFEKVFQKIKNIEGRRDYFWVANMAYVLGETDHVANESARKAILAKAEGRMDFNTAEYLSYYLHDGNIPKVGKSNIKDYLLNFRDVSHHERYFDSIVGGLGELYANKLISKDDLQVRLRSIIDDTLITLGERLYAEKTAYEHDVL
jgi:hypothetical protein